MSCSQHFRACFLALSYLALSLVPLLPLLTGQPVPQAWAILGSELLMWATIWALFGRPLYFHWLLLPAFLALPPQLYLLLYFGQGLSAHHLGLLAETTSAEALEFMGSRVWVAVGFLLASAAWWVLCFVAARRVQGLAWRGRSRWAFLALAGALAAVSAYGYEFGFASRDIVPTHALGLKDMPRLPSAMDLGREVDVAGSWPFGLAIAAIDYYTERSEKARLARVAQNFTFQAQQQQPDSSPETVVVVIGESSRYDRWSLNGYPRNTNPLLSQEGNLVVLTDMVSPVSSTRLSVPQIMTRRPPRMAASPEFHEKSFISAFKEAGFRTWWLSNQHTYGPYDTPFAPYSAEADVEKHVNPGGYLEQSTFDEALLPPLERALAAPAQRKLVVLHTLGSHWNYGRRYPKEFDHWQPSLSGSKAPDLGDPALQREAGNSYDNSIRYTDWFLAQVIGMLKQGRQRAVLVYVSDHGEVLGEQSCRLFLHDHNTEHEFHVPGLVWYADQYRMRYPDKIRALESHRSSHLSTPDIFHTVLDLADIRYPSERLQRSFARPGYMPRPRLVDSDLWIDYDTAERIGPCSELARPQAPK